MKSQQSTRILDWVIQDQVPPHINITGQVMNKIQQPAKRVNMHPRYRFPASLALAVGAIILLFSLVYAVYHWINDPGLESVRDTGLTTNLGETAKSAVLPNEQIMTPAPSVTLVNKIQIVEGVSMDLKWVYLDESRLLFGIQFSKLPSDVTVGFPELNVNGRPLGEQQQANKFIQVDESKAIYLSNQVMNRDSIGNHITLNLSIPLLRVENGAERMVAEFQFTVENVPLWQGQTLTFQQTKATSINGVEYQLHQFSIKPDTVKALLCSSKSDSMDFSIQQANLNGEGITEREMNSTEPVVDQMINCQSVTFDSAGIEPGSHLRLMINQKWVFDIDLPSEIDIPGIYPIKSDVETHSVASQSIDQLTVTLDWIYSDARRIAFGYSINGFSELPQNGFLGGTISVNDGLRNISMGGSSELYVTKSSGNQTNVLSGTWSSIFQDPIDQDQLDLSIDITLDGTHGEDWNYIVGQFQIPNESSPSSTGSNPIVIPDTLIGTFNFDVSTLVYPMTTPQVQQVVGANGIDMELVQAELTPSYSEFSLCYTKPSREDWLFPQGVTMTSGIEQTPIYTYTLLSDTDFNLKNPVPISSTTIQGENVRCVKLGFNLGHSNQPRTITLRVPALERSIPEVFPQDELDAALVKLKEQGIESTYITSLNVGGGGANWEFTKKPDGMTDAEAYDRLIDALGYRVSGPWVFTLKYQP